MSSTNHESSDSEVIIIGVKAASEGNRKTPAIHMLEGWNKSNGKVDVLAYGDVGGEDWQSNNEIDYRRGETTWPEQYTLCTIGLKLRCMRDTEDPKLFHAYGLMEQNKKVQGGFMGNVLTFRQPGSDEHKFPKMSVELREGGLSIEFDTPSQEMWINARDKQSMLWKEIVDELDSLVEIKNTSQPKSFENSSYKKSNEEQLTKIKVKTHINESVVVFLDRLAENWGFKSRGEVINKLLVDLLEEAPND